MKISVITPTAERASLLKGTYELLREQTYENWEWLIYDTSLDEIPFSDSRITYIHDTEIVPIGEKRNRLLEKSSGDAIVHFDDDDYYASRYLEFVVRQLKDASFFTFHGWFSYDAKTKQFFYWDTEELCSVHYCVNSLSGMRVREIDLGPFMQNQSVKLNRKGKTGYGFSFAYWKEVAQKCTFKALDLAEDRYFYEEALAAGFNIKTCGDRDGLAVHILHDANTSAEFPQYRIPAFLVAHLFPPFFDYVQKVYENRFFDR
jgi:glycosyltransferase involved in cell wall biosynthesis